MYNAYILDWTMNDFPDLKQKLSLEHFIFKKDGGGENIYVDVSFDRISAFTEIVQKFLNAPQNYIDIQYLETKTTVVIFRDRIFTITNPIENKKAQEWAISIGLPKEQSDWGISYTS